MGVSAINGLLGGLLGLIFPKLRSVTFTFLYILITLILVLLIIQANDKEICDKPAVEQAEYYAVFLKYRMAVFILYCLYSLFYVPFGHFYPMIITSSLVQEKA